MAMYRLDDFVFVECPSVVLRWCWVTAAGLWMSSTEWGSLYTRSAVASFTLVSVESSSRTGGSLIDKLTVVKRTCAPWPELTVVARIYDFGLTLIGERVLRKIYPQLGIYMIVGDACAFRQREHIGVFGWFGGQS